ncbi:MAG: PDGLE domain-containing protein [Gemmatimonadota bacterium]
MKEYRPLLVALAVMALLTPAGIYLPEILKAGGAWGEWGVHEVAKMIGYAPREMERSAAGWNAPLPDYSLPGRRDAPPGRRSLSYVLSAFVGVAACGAVAYLVSRRLASKGGKDRGP